MLGGFFIFGEFSFFGWLIIFFSGLVGVFLAFSFLRDVRRLVFGRGRLLFFRFGEEEGVGFGLG